MTPFVEADYNLLTCANQTLHWLTSYKIFEVETKLNLALFCRYKCNISVFFLLRMFIWRSLLNLPENHAAYSSLVDKGTHSAFVRIHEEYPIKSRKLLRVLQRFVSIGNFDVVPPKVVISWRDWDKPCSLPSTHATRKRAAILASIVTSVSWRALIFPHYLRTRIPANFNLFLVFFLFFSFQTINNLFLSYIPYGTAKSHDKRNLSFTYFVISL